MKFLCKGLIGWRRSSGRGEAFNAIAVPEGLSRADEGRIGRRDERREECPNAGRRRYHRRTVIHSLPPQPPTPPNVGTAPRWRRLLWLVGGGVALAVGIVGIFVPLLPTAPFVLLAAFCFSRGSERAERWLLEHRRFGPIVRAWRANRAVPLRAKQFASVAMTASALAASWLLAPPWRWLPAVCCAAVALWLWRLPTAATALPAPSAAKP